MRIARQSGSGFETENNKREAGEKNEMSESKKNLIPLVLAVVLARAAVFAVNRLLGQKEAMHNEEMVAVVVANRNLRPEEVLNPAAFTRKVIPLSAAPSKAVRWNQTSLILNQRMKKAVSRGDYIGLDDVGVSRGLGDMIGDGEWAVSISLNGGAITSRMHPGDEIAIIGTFTLKETKKSAVVGQKNTEVSRKITTVILPQVRVLALNVNQQQGGDEFVLALPPKQAQLLLSAQEHGISLAPAMRKPHDESNLNRTTAGLVDADTFNNLAQGVERISVPAVPSKK